MGIRIIAQKILLGTVSSDDTPPPSPGGSSEWKSSDPNVQLEPSQDQTSCVANLLDTANATVQLLVDGVPVAAANVVFDYDTGALSMNPLQAAVTARRGAAGRPRARNFG